MQITNRNSRKWIFIFLTIFFLENKTHAFSLTPMSQSLEPSGKGSTQSFLLENTGGETLPIQISMTERKMDALGNESNPEADDQFIVYPPQLILKPNEKRTVRVTWAGDPKPDHELAYRIIAEQLPVETEKKDKKKGAMIHMLLRYLGAIYITPRGVTSNVLIASSLLDSKKNEMVLTFENSGKAHQVLRGLKLKIISADHPENNLTLNTDAAELKDIAGQNILALSQRRFRFPWPEKIPKGPVRVELALEN